MEDEMLDKFELAYTSVFSSSADKVVLLMYAVSFVCYVLYAKEQTIRNLLEKYWLWFIALITSGNLLICILVWRLFENERILVGKHFAGRDLCLSDESSSFMLDAVVSAYELRQILILSNIVFFVLITFLVVHFTRKLNK